MNTLSWIVIGVIVAVIVLKNWDKIQPILFPDKKVQNVNGSEPIELTKAEIEKARSEKMQYLMNEKQKALDKIDSLTRELRADVKEIDMEIYLLQEQQGNTEKKWWKK